MIIIGALFLFDVLLVLEEKFRRSIYLGIHYSGFKSIYEFQPNLISRAL